MAFPITKKIGGLDYKVWATMLMALLIAIVVIIYKVLTFTSCYDYTITATGSLPHNDDIENTFYLGESITFEVPDLSNTAKVEWELENGISRISDNKIAYSFPSEGNYLIKAIISEDCEYSISVHIVSQYSSQMPNLDNSNPIISMDMANLGDIISFTTQLEAESYIWSVVEMPNMGIQKSQEAKFIFDKAGIFTIQLLADKERYTKTIQVNTQLPNQLQSVDESSLPSSVAETLPPQAPAPVVGGLPKSNEEKIDEPKIDGQKKIKPEEKPQKEYLQLPTPAIKNTLEKIVKNNHDPTELISMACQGLKTKVVLNGKTTNLDNMLAEIRQKKGVFIFKSKKKIKEVKVVRDPSNGNCIKILYVNN